MGSEHPTRYAYLGTSAQVSSTATDDGESVTLDSYSAIDAIGNRISTGLSSQAYLLVDLHGNVAAALSSGADPQFLAGFRYDAFGQSVDAYTGGGAPAIPYRFQGRILQSAEASTDLYDFGARSYDPSLGTFTSFDTVSGSAQNPLTLNRYLYALGNPATLVDPDGHASIPASCYYYGIGCSIPATCYYYGDAGCGGSQTDPVVTPSDPGGPGGEKPSTNPSLDVTPYTDPPPMVVENPSCKGVQGCPLMPMPPDDPRNQINDPFWGIGVTVTSSESVPTWYVDSAGNYHYEWDEIELSYQIGDGEISISGKPENLVQGDPGSVSALGVSFSAGDGSEGLSGSYDLPLNLGSLGAGTNIGLITIPHTGGKFIPGVDNTISYGATYTFNSPAGAPVKATVTITHHSVFVPGPDRYREAADALKPVAEVALMLSGAGLAGRAGRVVSKLIPGLGW